MRRPDVIAKHRDMSRLMIGVPGYPSYSPDYSHGPSRHTILSSGNGLRLLRSTISLNPFSLSGRVAVQKQLRQKPLSFAWAPSKLASSVFTAGRHRTRPTNQYRTLPQCLKATRLLNTTPSSQSANCPSTALHVAGGWIC